MTKLSDTQALILNAAAQRDNRIALPLPDSLRGGAAAKVVGAMIARGLLQEVDADVHKGETVWRQTDDGHGITLLATDAGLAAIGIEPEDADTGPAGVTGAPIEEAAPISTTATDPAPRARTLREGTKQETVIAMLRAPQGATVDEIAAATSWAHHTIRGFLSGALKKRLGLTITSEKVEERGRVYRLSNA